MIDPPVDWDDLRRTYPGPVLRVQALGHGEVTEDFTVVPVDLELTDLERNLRAVGARRA